MKHDDHLALTVVRFIGANTTIGLVGLLLLAWHGRAPDAALIGLVSGLSGALGAILVTARSNGGQRAGDRPAGTDADPFKVEAPEGGTVDVTPKAE